MIRNVFRPPAIRVAVFVFCTAGLAPSAGLFAQSGYRHEHLGHTHVMTVEGARAVCLGLPARLSPRARPRGKRSVVIIADGAGQQEFILNLIGFTPEAQAAFEQAAQILADNLDLTVPVEVEAMFEALDEDVLGSAGPNGVFLPQPGSGLPALTPAQLDQLLGEDQSGPGEPDITASFNSEQDAFFFGLAGDPPANEVDFVSVVLHELIHGLGFVHSFMLEAGTGSWGVAAEPFPLLFDTFVLEGEMGLLTDPANFTNPSTALGDALVGGNLFFAGPEASSAAGGNPPQLFAPPEFQMGSSIAHFDEAAFPSGTPDSLMTPAISSGEVNRAIGPITRGSLRDLGFTTLVTQTLDFPQFGAGSGLTSDIVLANLSPMAVEVTATLFDEDGNDITNQLLGGGANQFSIPTLGSTTLTVSAGAEELFRGSVRVEADGRVLGVIRFELPGTGTAGVGAAPSLASAIAPVRLQGNVNTGVAFRNTTGSPITVDLTLKDQNGQQVPNGSAQFPDLAANARIAGFIDELFPDAQVGDGFQGTICISTQNGTFAAVAVELEVGNAFTTLPVGQPD